MLPGVSRRRAETHAVVHGCNGPAVLPPLAGRFFAAMLQREDPDPVLHKEGARHHAPRLSADRSTGMSASCAGTPSVTASFASLIAIRGPIGQRPVRYLRRLL